MQRAVAHKSSSAEMSAEFRNLEYRLIDSLLTGGERLGVIGNTARNSLKRMPSGMYWAALGAWRIRTGDFSSDGYFRRQYDYRQLSVRTAKADDPEARERLPGTGLDPHLPQPPDEWLKAVDFALTPEEEQYLSDLIAASTKGSMLSWLIHNQPGSSPGYVWEIDNLNNAPEQLRDLVDHARRFHTVIRAVAVCKTVGSVSRRACVIAVVSRQSLRITIHLAQGTQVRCQVARGAQGVGVVRA